jgi:hypothetical protein
MRSGRVRLMKFHEVSAAQPFAIAADTDPMQGPLSAEAFYRLLIALDAVLDPAPLVAEAIEMMMCLANARLGYVELFAVASASWTRRAISTRTSDTGVA